MTSSSVISAVHARLLVVPLPSYMRYFGYDSINVPYIEVRDSDGRLATGFSYTLDAGAGIVCAMVSELVGPALVGRSPEEWDRIRLEVLASTRRLGATTFVAAVSAVDIAVWDLRGQRAAQPLYRLFGGTAEPVPFYGSGRSGQRMSTAELVEHSLDYLADGFHAVKVAIGALPAEVDVARVAAVRDAVGDDVRVMVDASERLSLDEALAIGSSLDDLDLFWFEEPLRAEDVRGYGILSRSLGTPIATGEHFQQLETFERYLDETATAFYQPDAALGGGLTAMLAVASLARAAERPVAWHSLADLHVHLASEGTTYIEDFPILDNIIAEPLRPSAGFATAPDRPGHGITWDVDAIAAFTAAAYDAAA